MKKKISDVLFWLTLNGLLLAGLWFGFVYGIQGAQNIGMFLVWACIATSFIMLSKTVQYKHAEKNIKGTIPTWINFPLNVCILIFLLWFNQIFVAIFWAIHMFLMVGFKEVVKELKEKLKKEDLEKELKNDPELY
jgi:L-asparagine transporter-like permease